ncbi:MAG TPA: hypothetical protein VGP46_12395, partial [Acidimicrobiales bacterium]|nr:hypothetical protein [Acidimicrobiales bacterium]
AGIAPASVPGYVLAEVAGGLLGLVVIKALYPDVTPAEAADVVVPHARANGHRPGETAEGCDGAAPAKALPPRAAGGDRRAAGSTPRRSWPPAPS